MAENEKERKERIFQLWLNTDDNFKNLSREEQEKIVLRQLEFKKDLEEISCTSQDEI
jgi:hypothetical protein